MSNILHSIRRGFVMMGRVFAREWHLLLHDPGALLFFIALPLAYPIVYTLVYNPEVVREIPVAIVDHSRTAQSRELVRVVSASPTIDVYGYASNLEEAKRWMAETKVFGVLEIPEDYARKLGRNEQAVVPFYSDMSLLLRYRAFTSALSDIQIKIAGDITGSRIEETPLSALAAGRDVHLPVKQESHFLGDTEQGFASFVIPGIIILILQQSMILGICLLGGTAQERRRRTPGGIDPEAVQGAGPWATIWGKTLCYFVLYIPLSLYVTRFVPEFFSLPHYGSAVHYLLFLVPLLLASAFLGQSLLWFMRERESAFIIIVFTSVVFLFLSGLTWPRYAMSKLWTMVGDLVPGTWGVEGFIRINSNSASLAEVSTSYIALWILTGLYMVLAWITTMAVRRRAARIAAVNSAEDKNVQLSEN